MGGDMSEMMGGMSDPGAGGGEGMGMGGLVYVAVWTK